MPTFSPEVLAALQSSRVTPQQAALIAQTFGNGRVANEFNNQNGAWDIFNSAPEGVDYLSPGSGGNLNHGGLDVAAWLSGRGPSEGGNAGARQTFQDLTSSFRGQPVQTRQQSVDIGEGQTQNFTEFLNPLTNKWDRSDNGDNGRNPDAEANLRQFGIDPGQGSVYARSGGLLTGPTGTQNTSLIPRTQYISNGDGTYRVGEYNYGTPQNHITGQENLAGVLAVLGGAALGYYGYAPTGAEAGGGGAGASGSGGLDFASGFTDGGTAGGALDSGYAGVAGGGGVGPNFSGGYTDTGTAGGALDTGYAGSGLTPYTGSPSSTPPAGAAGGGGSGGSPAGSTSTPPAAGTGGGGGSGSSIGSSLQNMASNPSNWMRLVSGAAGLLGGAGGALAGAQGQQGNVSTQNQMDPAMRQLLYSDGGVLNSTDTLFRQQMAQGGLNDRQRQGLDMQFNHYTNPANMQGYQAISNAGQGLLGRGVAANRFTR